MVSCDVACHVMPARINTRTYDRSLASVPISTFRYEDTTRCAIKSLVRCGGGHFKRDLSILDVPVWCAVGFLQIIARSLILICVSCQILRTFQSKNQSEYNLDSMILRKLQNGAKKFYMIPYEANRSFL